MATILGSSPTFIDATVGTSHFPGWADLHGTIIDVQWVVEADALFLGTLILVVTSRFGFGLHK